MIQKDFQWWMHCIACIEHYTNEREYQAFLDEFNNSKTLYEARCIITRWYTNYAV